MKAAVALLVAALLCLPAWSAPRSHTARAEFQRAHPCPSTGKPRGACPGYVVDHVRPLCAAGADAPENMAWQTVADGKVKDREERRMCKRGQAR